MSGFTKKNWADSESDSESETKELQNDNSDDNSDSDSDADGDDAKLNLIVEQSNSAISNYKKVDVTKLSKKERKAMKEKELEDLDSLLQQFSADLPTVNGDGNSGNSDGDNNDNSNSVSNSNGIDNDEATNTEKKKKKKKKTTKKDDTITDATTSSAGNNDNNNTETTAAIDTNTVDIKDVLRAKAAKKAASKNDASQKAIAEALKVTKENTNNKKKKKDKSKFNEYSY